MKMSTYINLTDILKKDVYKSQFYANGTSAELHGSTYMDKESGSWTVLTTI